MNVSIDMPNKTAEHLKAAWGDLSQAAKEALAIESYRTEKLSVGGVAEMLGLTVLETDEFLKKHGVDMPYTLHSLYPTEEPGVHLIIGEGEGAMPGRLFRVAVLSSQTAARRWPSGFRKEVEA